ncbi:GAP family protein [Nostoc mirabile]|uniref:GAP family protein n=1 Tax=Nostoc mirabile TaxID=2907820 RepID=UPI001E35DB88|nr:GAP family protein [Nostoc mirabile]
MQNPLCIIPVSMHRGFFSLHTNEKVLSVNTLLISLIPLAAVDSLNPTTTALQIYLLITPKPLVRSITFILGIIAGYWTAGLLIALGFSKVIVNVINSADKFIYVIQFIIGIVLIIIGSTLNQSFGKQATIKHPKSLKPMSTFVLGVVATLWDVPTALPYIIAIERIVAAKLNLLKLIGVLGFYNLIFVLPLIVLLWIYIMMGNKSAVLLERINRQMAKWFPKIMQVLMVCFGLLLVVDSTIHAFNRLLQQ